MPRLLAAGVLLVALTLTAGCRPGGGGAARPVPTSTPGAEVTPTRETVGVVDMQAVLRSHRRWPELESLLKRLEVLQIRLNNPLPPPVPPAAGADIKATLQAEADRLFATMQAEVTALEEQAKRRFDAFVADLRAEQEGKLADRQRALNAEYQKAIEAKRDEFQRELEKFELTTMAEYRLPLLNLRLKADVVGVTNEEEGKRLSEEADRLLRQRDEKIKVKAQALDKGLDEFQKARSSEAETQLKSLIKSLEDEGATKIESRQAEMRAELQAEAKTREAALHKAIDERRKLLVGGTEEQLRAAQEQYARQVQAEGTKLQAEIQKVQEQRIRLEDSVLAEIKIELASVAQERRVDVVLMRALATTDAVDLTKAVIARMRRP
ncbi:MAG TPA: hypothetical protein VFM39_00315 [bacterium]|nr:hypothetical protein [bacterium]